MLLVGVGRAIGQGEAIKYQTNGGVGVLRLDDRPQKEANIEEGQPVSEMARPASCVCVFCVPDGWMLGVGCKFFFWKVWSLSRVSPRRRCGSAAGRGETTDDG